MVNLFHFGSWSHHLARLVYGLLLILYGPIQPDFSPALYTVNFNMYSRQSVMITANFTRHKTRQDTRHQTMKTFQSYQTDQVTQVLKEKFLRTQKKAFYKYGFIKTKTFQYIEHNFILLGKPF